MKKGYILFFLLSLLFSITFAFLAAPQCSTRIPTHSCMGVEGNTNEVDEIRVSPEYQPISVRSQLIQNAQTPAMLLLFSTLGMGVDTKAARADEAEKEQEKSNANFVQRLQDTRGLNSGISHVTISQGIFITLSIKPVFVCVCYIYTLQYVLYLLHIYQSKQQMSTSSHLQRRT